MDNYLQDIRHAARALYRHALFTVSTIATLALGIGVVTGFFAIVDAVLLTPLAPHCDTVVRVWKLEPERSIARFPLTYPELTLWRERTRSFRSLAAIHYADTSTAAAMVGRDPVPVAIDRSPPSSSLFFMAGCRSSADGSWRRTKVTRPSWPPW